jgi:hypothetical protein
MPKVKQIGKFEYKYECECGKEITFYTDDPKITQVKKCFNCQHKIKEKI